MSSLGKIPNFEPDEEAMAMIKSLFEQKKEVAISEGGTTSPRRHRIRIPEPPAQTKLEQEEALVYAKDEVEQIHSSFVEFVENIEDTTLYGYLYTEIQKLIEAFKDMDDLVNDKINKDELTLNGISDYERMRKLRHRILSDIYNQSKKEE